MTVVASGYDRPANDLYQTEPYGTRALLRHFPCLAKRVVWEPCAGGHMMADVLRDAGAAVVTSDIATYGRRHDYIFDFLDERLSPPVGCGGDAIVTNPPYGKQNRLAAKFARLALARCSGFVAVLCQAKFDFGKTRGDLFQSNPRFVGKIAFLDRLRWFGDTEGTEDHAWYVWGPAEAVQKGPPILLYARRGDQ